MTPLDLIFATVAIIAVIAGCIHLFRLGVSWRGHLVSDSAAQEVSELAALRARREHLLQDLRDLGLDHSMGKLSDEDFHSARIKVEPQVLAVLKEIERRELALDLDEFSDDDDLDEESVLENG